MAFNVSGFFRNLAEKAGLIEATEPAAPAGTEAGTSTETGSATDPAAPAAPAEPETRTEAGTDTPSPAAGVAGAAAQEASKRIMGMKRNTAITVGAVAAVAATVIAVKSFNKWRNRVNEERQAQAQQQGMSPEAPAGFSR